jgi:3-(methylthio)propanoyl-CoA dehydrogenase
VRIASIYEGTTGIQANDLIGRKLARDRGAAMKALLDDLLSGLEAAQVTRPEAVFARKTAIEALLALREAAAQVLALQVSSAAPAQAVSVPFLKLCGLALGGALMARAAAVADAALASQGDAFYESKLQTCRFYAGQVLPEALGLARIVSEGAESVTAARVELI